MCQIATPLLLLSHLQAFLISLWALGEPPDHPV